MRFHPETSTILQHKPKASVFKLKKIKKLLVTPKPSQDNHILYKSIKFNLSRIKEQHLIFWFLDGIFKYYFLAFLGKSEGKEGKSQEKKKVYTNW